MEIVVNVINDDGTPRTTEELEFERQRIIAEGNTPIVPGSKTDSALLLTSLQDEREKRRIAEAELAALKGSPAPANNNQTPESTEALNKRIDDLEKDNQRKDLIMDYPVLKDKAAEFETYLTDPDNAGMSMKTAAKAFLVENGLLGVRRPGLEKPTGGDRQPPSTGMTVDEVKTLRETNFKKYVELLEKGLIKV